MTFEITASNKDQRDWLTGRIGLMLVEWERLDKDTYNITVPDDVDDSIIVEWAEEHTYGCRLV